MTDRALAARLPAGRCTAHVRTSTRAAGDFHVDGPRAALLHRRQAFQPGAWTQLDEVHGTRVVVVTSPGEHDLEVADAAVTAVPGAVLGAWVADCAPVVLVGSTPAGDGVVGAAHAGWRGALDGVLGATVAALRGLGAADVTAILGPCIHGCCDEFGTDLLGTFAERFGPEVRTTTTWGTPSLDMPAVVRAALAEHGVPLDDRSECTRCHADRWFSHRRGDLGRQVMTVRLVGPA